jgi:hypothetical protein
MLNNSPSRAEAEYENTATRMMNNRTDPTTPVGIFFSSKRNAYPFFIGSIAEPIIISLLLY